MLFKLPLQVNHHQNCSKNQQPSSTFVPDLFAKFHAISQNYVSKFYKTNIAKLVFTIDFNL